MFKIFNKCIKISDKKSVQFNPVVKVILVPIKEEYIEKNIAKDIWWKFDYLDKKL